MIARQIVQMHGGRIWAGDNAGGGSEFAFAIPAARTAAGAGAGRSAGKTA